MTKASKQEVNYREGTPARHCGNCRKFLPPHGCVGVAGKIEPDDLCDRYAKAKP